MSFLSAGLWGAINWFATELKVAEQLEEEKKKRAQEAGSGDDTETEVETVIGTTGAVSGSKEVEVLPPKGEIKDRRSLGAKSETSTEDEWERVSENEKDK